MSRTTLIATIALMMGATVADAQDADRQRPARPGGGDQARPTDRRPPGMNRPVGPGNGGPQVQPPRPGNGGPQVQPPRPGNGGPQVRPPRPGNGGPQVQPPRPGNGGPQVQPPRPGNGGPQIQPPRPGNGGPQIQPPRPGNGGPQIQPPRPGNGGRPPVGVRPPRPPHGGGNWQRPPVSAPQYRYPRGYGYRRWNPGLILPSIFLSSGYYYNNYAALGFGPPPSGYRLVRYGPDLLLVRRKNGHIKEVYYNVFG